MPKLSDTVTIYKHLPTGRRVERQVTGEEYINNGWFKNGWATNAGLQIKAAKQYAAQFAKQAETMPIDHLRGWTRSFPIVKKLPNGKWAKVTVTGGEFEHDGWRTQGWFIPSWAKGADNRSYTGAKDTDKAREYYWNRVVKEQDWWRPRMSRDQAWSYYSPLTRLTGPYVGHNQSEDVTKLQSGKYKLNTNAWYDWIDKAQDWMYHNRKRRYNRAMRQTKFEDRHRMLLPMFVEYSRTHPAPARVVPIHAGKQKPVYARRIGHTRYALNYQ